MTKRYYLYRITNTANGKVYIGWTGDLRTRWANHRARARNPNCTQTIYKAIRKYGLDSFLFEHIATSPTKSDAKVAEVDLIKQYDSYGAGGYNDTRGGDGGWWEGRRAHPNTLAALHKASKRQTWTMERRQRVSNSLRGHSVSEQTRAKLRTAKTGRKMGPMPDRVKAKISASRSRTRLSNILTVLGYI